MTYEEIINTLHVCSQCACGDCPLGEREDKCNSLVAEAASALEDLVKLARNNEERECEAEENTANLKHKLACKQKENEILRSELRRMFWLYVAAEMRADTGTEEVDDA